MEEVCPPRIHTQVRVWNNLDQIRLIWDTFPRCSAARICEALQYRTGFRSRGEEPVAQHAPMSGYRSKSEFTWEELTREGACHPESIARLCGGGGASIFKTYYVSEGKARKRVEKIFPRQGKVGVHGLILPPSQLLKNPLLRAPESTPYSLFHLDYCYLGQVL